MLLYFATALPLLFIIFTGFRFPRISSFLLLFSDALSISALISGESFIPLLISITLIIVLLLIDFTRNNLKARNLFLIIILSLLSGVFSYGVFPLVVLLIILKRPSMAAAISAAAALSFYISKVYFLDFPLSLLPLVILVLIASLSNWKTESTLSKA